MNKTIAPEDNNTPNMKEFLKRVNNKRHKKGSLPYRHHHQALQNNLRNYRKNPATNLLYRKFTQARNLIKLVKFNQEIKD